jgi:hypothetical protein
MRFAAHTDLRKEESIMKPLKVFAVGAEITVVSTLAVASYNVAFAGANSASDWLAGAPILTVMALESLRLPMALNLFRSKLLGFLLSCTLITSISVATGEAAFIAYENLIFQRSRPVAEAERDLKKAETTRDAAVKAKVEGYDTDIAQLKDAVEKAKAHQIDITKIPADKHEMPNPLSPPVYQAPVLLPVPTAQSRWVPPSGKKRGYWYTANQAAIDAANKANAEAQRKAQEDYDRDRNKVIDRNSTTQEQINQENTEAQKRHDEDLAAASAAVKAAQDKLDAASTSAPNTHDVEAAVEAARQKVIDARTMNPMFRVAAAWQKVPVQDLSLEQFEQVKHWAVVALAVVTAVGSSLAGIIASLPERTGQPSKLSRMLRAWIARRRKKIYRDVPGPEVIKEVEVVKEVPVPGPERIKEVVKEVPGPIEYRYSPGPTQFVEVPGPERIVEKIVTRDVPGPIEYRDVIKTVNVPGPVEYREVEKIVNHEVPGPERIVEKVLVKWVPYDVATGLRIKPDGSLSEERATVAQMRTAQ